MGFNPFKSFTNFVNDAVDTVKGAVSDAADTIGGAASDAWDTTRGLVRGCFSPGSFHPRRSASPRVVREHPIRNS